MPDRCTDGIDAESTHCLGKVLCCPKFFSLSGMTLHLNELFKSYMLSVGMLCTQAFWAHSALHE